MTEIICVTMMLQPLEIAHHVLRAHRDRNIQRNFSILGHVLQHFLQGGAEGWYLSSGLPFL